VCITFFAESKVYAQTDSTVSEIIDLTGITRDTKGNPVVDGKYVTRAELAQMLVSASSYAGEVNRASKTKLFKDVSNSNQSAYIEIAVSKAYMSGYLRGEFKPDKAVTFKEAIYGTLAILGYTNEDFSGKLTDARYDKFRELGLNDNLSLSETDKLTKKKCEILFYNLLNAKMKSGDVYAKSLGYSLNENNKIDYQALLAIKTKGPVVTKSGWDKVLKNKLYSYKIWRDGMAVTANMVDDSSIAYYAEQSRTIWIYSQKIYGTLDNISYNAGKPRVFTVAGTDYTIEKPEDMNKLIKDTGIQKGMLIILLLGRNDEVAYILPIQSMKADSIWHNKLSFDVNSATVYKNGSKVTADDIESGDVIYYSNELKTLWAYNKKAFGVIKTITPNTATPQSVVVAGVTYSLDLSPIDSTADSIDKTNNLVENAWGKRLDENGIEEGDNVVVLFGYDGKVADICTVDKMAVTLTGYVLSVADKIVKDEGTYSSGMKRVIKMVDTQGVVREFPCTDTSIDKQTIVLVSFKDGQPIIAKVNTTQNRVPSDINTKKMAEGVRLLEINNQNFSVITAKELQNIAWSEAQVVYYQLNSKDEITDLILSNVTYSAYKYALLKKVVFPEFDSFGGLIQFTFAVGDTELSLTADSVKGDMNPGPKALSVQDNKIVDIQPLTQVQVSYIKDMQANTGDAVARISDDVQVYFYTKGEYYSAKLENITNFKSNGIKGYMDLQGLIRIIIVTE
jgi:hypothetical protein